MHAHEVYPIHQCVRSCPRALHSGRQSMPVAALQPLVHRTSATVLFCFPCLTPCLILLPHVFLHVFPCIGLILTPHARLCWHDSCVKNMRGLKLPLSRIAMSSCYVQEFLPDVIGLLAVVMSCIAFVLPLSFFDWVVHDMFIGLASTTCFMRLTRAHISQTSKSHVWSSLMGGAVVLDGPPCPPRH